MNRSTGTKSDAVSPDEVIPKLGAEVLRLWCVSSNYMDDLRCSDEILLRVSDGYRKLRNTARFALGNLDGGQLAILRRECKQDCQGTVDRANAITQFLLVIHVLPEAADERFYCIAVDSNCRS